MTGSPRTSHRPAGRLFVLLVLAVLTGVLGMHALPPGAAPTPEHAMADDTGGMARGLAVAAGVGVGVNTAHSPAKEQASAVCSHDDGGSGHLAHADGMCAAAGIGSAYTPPVPADGLPDPDAPAAAGAVSAVPVSGVRGRPPPDLSELQLLRI
ncbi:DUF6153 family protein [Streptomyces sp. NPDC001868]|uniref:DUF6153 family protein n=1 Tax=Streptomyces sp. NPDC001868 TaxID=3154401 RepID=UPI00331C7A05